MNYVLLTEGTGKGVHERTNVSVLAEACVQDAKQCVHLERGPGTRFGAIVVGHVFGMGALNIVLRHYEWLAQRYRVREESKIFLFGFSRGAMIARVLADLICNCGIPVDAYDARKVFKWWMGGHYPEAVQAFRKEGRLLPGRVDYLGVWDTVDSSIGIDGERYRRIPELMYPAVVTLGVTLIVLDKVSVLVPVDSVALVPDIVAGAVTDPEATDFVALLA